MATFRMSPGGVHCLWGMGGGQVVAGTGKTGKVRVASLAGTVQHWGGWSLIGSIDPAVQSISESSLVLKPYSE